MHFICGAAQRRARQTSVACQLLHPSSSSTSLSSSSHSRRRPYVSSDLHRSSEDIDTERRNEDRHQEIAKILSLKDPKEQVDRFLKLIQHCGMGESSSSWKTAPKVCFFSLYEGSWNVHYLKAEACAFLCTLIVPGL